MERNTWEESEWWVLDQSWFQGCRSSSRTRAASPRDVCRDDRLSELVLRPWAPQKLTSVNPRPG